MSDLLKSLALVKTAAANAMGAPAAVPASAAPAAANVKMAENMNVVDDLQLAKLAAIELYEDASQKVAYAIALYNEATLAEKVAADSGAGTDVPLTDQQITMSTAQNADGALSMAMSSLAAGGPVGGANWGAAAGALNAFLEANKKRRALENASAPGGNPINPPQ